MVKIIPTVGRVMWYYVEGGAGYVKEQPPQAGIVAAVNNEGNVNLGVLSFTGIPYGVTGVPVWQGEGEPPIDPFCMWMPYQKGQAAAQAAKVPA